MTSSKVVNIVARALAMEIKRRAVRNLNSIEFAQSKLDGTDYRRSRDKPRHNWSISNKGILARSGYVKSERRIARHECGFKAPYAYYVNYGTAPGAKNVPFEEIYNWAYQRKKEIKKDFPELKFPRKKENPDFYKFFARYQGDKIKGHRVERIPFMFAYYTWAGIKKNGLNPTFFFSDAVYTTCRDAKRVIADAFRTPGKFLYDEGSDAFSFRGEFEVEG